MSQTSTLKGQCIAEFLGTGLLIFFGVGCVAALKVKLPELLLDCA
ncbi:Glycerol uptake facilitator protein [Salmonella enterica subsp. enterica serovar Minnesota str. A4-603]|nr:Glycerol uptake facilitator protein [Salmonella enterica subsp. enterica serovar Minnesota str. A4-603]